MRAVAIAPPETITKNTSGNCQAAAIASASALVPKASVDKNSFKKPVILLRAERVITKIVAWISLEFLNKIEFQLTS